VLVQVTLNEYPKLSCLRRHTSAYVTIRQRMSAYVAPHIGPSHVERVPKLFCIRQHTSVYVSIRQRTSAWSESHWTSSQSCPAYVSVWTYVSVCQHTSAYVSIREHTSEYVSMREHTSAYFSIRQHTSAYVSYALKEESCRHPPGSTLLLLYIVLYIYIYVYIYIPKVWAYVYILKVLVAASQGTGSSLLRY
jgi:hypothetical protein